MTSYNYDYTHWLEKSHMRMVLSYRMFLRLKSSLQHDITINEYTLKELVQLFKALAFDGWFSESYGPIYQMKLYGQENRDMSFYYESMDRNKERIELIEEIKTKIKTQTELDAVIYSLLSVFETSVKWKIAYAGAGPGRGSTAAQCGKYNSESSMKCRKAFQFCKDVNVRNVGKKIDSDFRRLDSYLKSNSSYTFVTEDYLALNPEFFFQDEYDVVVRLLKKNPSILKKMDSRNFEEIIADIFEKNGYSVTLTSKTRDGGFDIIALDKDDHSGKFLIECKRYENRKVGVNVVRELHGVVENEGATKGIIVTSSDGFTRDAKKHLENNKEKLEGISFSNLIEWLRVYDDC